MKSVKWVKSSRSGNNGACVDADQVRVLGPDHPGTLYTRGSLAYWRGKAGDVAGAIAAFEHLFTDFLRVLGPGHRDTSTIRRNLANWRGEAGDAAGAVAALEQLLADQVRVLGPDHPDTLTTRNNLAYWRGRADGHRHRLYKTEYLDDHG